DDAGRVLGLARVNPAERRVRVRAAQKIGVGLIRAVDVVDVVAFAREEAEIFFAANRGADSGVRHQRPPAISSAPALIAFTILWSPVQRQILPSSHSRISCSDGCLLRLAR